MLLCKVPFCSDISTYMVISNTKHYDQCVLLIIKLRFPKGKAIHKIMYSDRYKIYYTTALISFALE